MLLVSYMGKSPRIAPDAFVAETSVLIGDVEIGSEANIWFGAVLRGDVGKIIIKPRASIQDNCVIHCDVDQETIVGEGAILGHGVVLHSCQVGSQSLIGINSTILDGAQIGEFSIVAAGSVVLEGAVFPDHVLVAGAPARTKRYLDESSIASLRTKTFTYIELSKRYREGDATGINLQVPDNKQRME